MGENACAGLCSGLSGTLTEGQARSLRFRKCGKGKAESGPSARLRVPKGEDSAAFLGLCQQRTVA